MNTFFQKHSGVLIAMLISFIISFIVVNVNDSELPFAVGVITSLPFFGGFIYLLYDITISSVEPFKRFKKRLKEKKDNEKNK